MPFEPTSQGHVTEVTGVVLAGGQSRRFGSNKALAAIGNSTLIERLIRTLESIFPHLVIVTNQPQDFEFLNLPMIEDYVKGLGPLGGIYSALHAIGDPYAFVAACDMPDLSPELIRFLLRLREGYDVVVPRIETWLEPLHAVYSKRCLGPIKNLLDRGERQVFQFFSQVKVRYVDLWEMQEVAPGHCYFYNINTRDDLDEFLRKEKN
jgi:molybdopterin-guanine dinucleotide biosynthesis protein A